MQIYEKTRLAEEKMARLFGSRRDFSENLRKWEDPALPDKHDHNCFEYKSQPTPEEFAAALDYQRQTGANFIKLEGDFPLDRDFGLEMGLTLTMAAPADKSLWRLNRELTFNRPGLAELEELEVKHYGPVYGEDFCRRNIRRLYEKLDYHGAYLGGKLAGACYSFTAGDLPGAAGVTCLDGLLVDEDLRNRYIATSLLAWVMDLIRPELLFLHADAEDTPQDMYRKMGFSTVDRLYEYSCADLSKLGR